MSAETILQRAARRYSARRTAAAFLLAAGAASLAGALALRGGAAGWAAALVACVTLAAAWALALRLARPVSAAVVARHLDRVVPELEESSELLLHDENTLPLLDRLERRRVSRALMAAVLPPLGDRMAMAWASLGAVGLLAALLLLGTASPGRIAALPRDQHASASGPPTIVSVSVSIRPPAYTGTAARRQRAWELDVEEGSLVQWELELAGAPTQPALITTAGDTVTLARGESGAFRGELVARRSLLYRIELDQDRGDLPEIHRLLVRADAPPAITVLRPAPRTVLDPAAIAPVGVEVLATDDYGVAGAELLATITSGTGEGVRFRDVRIPLSAPRRDRGGLVFPATLDPGALGMAPGDELYFHVLARDHRRPTPNVSRSGTVFLSLADTAESDGVALSGIALPVAPEYFRSQRQVILDTERLIADAPRLPSDIAAERSNAIGMDQGLLRLRYGQFTGEEFEGEVAAGEEHEHDTAENATLLSPSVKARLKAAIAEMWAAELRLRTNRPAEALPYEYRALELIKSVQQESRAYVQRVGFEAPPLDPSRRRLTGNLAEIPSRTLTDSLAPAVAQPATTEALRRVRALSDGDDSSPADLELLAAAEAELTARAIADTSRTTLAAIRRIRELAASLRSGTSCAACVEAAESALLSVLDAPLARPMATHAPGRLGRRYAELLSSGP